jgi:hypothetical protein
MTPATQQLALDRIDSARRMVEQGFAVLPADTLREVAAVLSAEAASDLQGALDQHQSGKPPCAS